MNKSSKIFLTIAGIYLFLLTYVLLTQPRSGNLPTTKQVFLSCLSFLPLWALTVGIVLIAKKYHEAKWFESAFLIRTLLWAISLLVLAGFVFNLDYQRKSGCFVMDEPDFSPIKFFLSISSLTLLFVGYHMVNIKFGISLLIFEFAFWTFKSLYFNSSLDLFVSAYFIMLCWILRVIFITKVLNGLPSIKAFVSTKNALTNL